MTARQRLREELRTVTLYTVLFGAWFLGFMLAKDLVLAEYEIGPMRITSALVAAVILAKVVLVLEHVPLGRWTREQPAWADVLLRTVLYGAGVLLVLIAEKAFELRDTPGGAGSALLLALRHEDTPHVVANALCATGALLVFNAMSVVRRHLGSGGLLQMFVVPMPDERVRLEQHRSE